MKGYRGLMERFNLNVSKTSELVTDCNASNMDVAPKMLHILKHR